MTFTTLTFLIFFAVVFALYWSFRNRRTQNVLLVIASYVFYGWWDWRFCGLMLASSLLDYFIGIGLDRSVNETKRKWVLTFGMCCNLGLLGYFKYFNFFTESLRIAAAKLGWHFDAVTLNVVLPVGISFYTFQTMSYAIDIYRRKMHANRNLIDYLAYVSFFPQLVAGPIERAAHLLPQFAASRHFSYEDAADGCRQILWGLFKKMAVADNLAPLVNQVFNRPTAYGGAELLVAVGFFAIQIYCDFSAYSEIASGTARLLGFKLMRNFDRPYFAENLRDFWRRWHISLTTWFRDYVYVSLGGSHGPRWRTVLNILIVFVLSGIWHGASWNFVAWGTFHGLAFLPSIWLRSGDAPSQHPVIKALKILGVFAIVCIGWVFFRANTLAEAFQIVSRVIPAMVNPASWPKMFSFATETPVDYSIFALLSILFLAEWLHRSREHAFDVQHWSRLCRWPAYYGLAVIVLVFGTHNTSSFIYFQF